MKFNQHGQWKMTHHRNLPSDRSVFVSCGAEILIPDVDLHQSHLRDCMHHLCQLFWEFPPKNANSIVELWCCRSFEKCRLAIADTPERYDNSTKLCESRTSCTFTLLASWHFQEVQTQEFCLSCGFAAHYYSTQWISLRQHGSQILRGMVL